MTSTLTRKNVDFIVGGYSILANDPMFYSRSRELSAVRDNAAIHGIYDISEQIGVSPWYFWTDTPPKQSKNHYVILNKKVQGPPSVKYRGFFLNDEQPALTNWVA